MKYLNLGSSNPKGKYKSKDWCNLDYCLADDIQLRGSAFELPFRDNSFELIHSVHMLEHLSRDKTIPTLKECYRTLKPGGRLFIEVPNFEQIVYLLADAYKAKDEDMIHIWKTSCFGKSERRGMSHLTGFHNEQLISYLKSVGFINVQRETEMISSHYLQEPVILISGDK